MHITGNEKTRAAKVLHEVLTARVAASDCGEHDVVGNSIPFRSSDGSMAAASSVV